MSLIPLILQKKKLLGSKLNLCQVADAWNTNDAANVQEIFYQLNGTDYQIDGFVPIKGSKFAKYPIIVDGGGFIRLNEANVGTISSGLVSSIWQNYDSKTGVWTTGSANQYTQEVGATMTYVFTGTRIEFRSYTDTRGGLWSFVIDGGDPILISTYATVAGNKYQEITNTLSNSEHTIVGTFLGNDPNNTPTDTARGWAYFGDEVSSGTFRVDVYADSYTSEVSIQSSSNVELAFKAAKSGSAYAQQWFPYHGDITTIPVSRSILIDGVAISDFSASDILSCQKIEIKGTYTIINTNEAGESLITLTQNFRIDKYGYYVDYELEALQDTFISNYGWMLPVHRSWATQLLTNLGDVYSLTDSDAVIDSIANEDSVRSFKVTSSINANYQLTSVFVNLNALRPGQDNRGYSVSPYPVLFIENRNDATVNKIYAATYRSKTLIAGEKHRVKNIYYIGGV